MRRRKPISRQSLRARERARNLTSLRQQLFERSRGYCEAERFSSLCTGVGVHAHHRLRRSQGGADTLDNLLWLCRPCHEEIHGHPQRAYDLGMLWSQYRRPDAVDAVLVVEQES